MTETAVRERSRRPSPRPGNAATPDPAECSVSEADSYVAPGFAPKRFLKVPFARCPVGLSLGILSRKWSLLILRDIGAYRVDRFNRLLESIPGIAPKVLSTRLRELEAAGLIRKVETRRSPKLVRWDLTERGLDLVPVLMLVTAYQSKWNAALLHPGRPPMKVHEIYDRRAMRLLERML